MRRTRCLHSKLKTSCLSKQLKPNMMGAGQRHSAGAISARHKTSVIRSPVYGLAHMLPFRPLAPLLRVSSPCCQDDELIAQARKTPGPSARHRLLDEAINKTMREGKWERSPIAGPTSTLYAHSPLFWPMAASFGHCYSHAAFASLVGRCFCMVPVVLHANQKG